MRRERRAVVWPVSCLVRGRTCPGGRTLVLRRPGRPCPALMARPGPPGLPGEGPVPGRWVKNRPERHLAPVLPRRVPGTAASGVRPSRGHAHLSPQSHRALDASRAHGGTLCDDCGRRPRCAAGPRSGRKQAVTVSVLKVPGCRKWPGMRAGTWQACGCPAPECLVPTCRHGAVVSGRFWMSRTTSLNP